MSAYVNLSDYPIDRPDSPEYRSMVEEQKNRLATEGMINLPDFLTPAGVSRYRQEIEAHRNVAFHAVGQRHPYGYHRSDEFPDDHPCNTFGPTESYRLARHHLPDTEIDELYCWQSMRKFVADVTGNEQIYLSGDPSNGLVVQVYTEGCGQAWHFDQALFSTIINLSESDEGGIFECVPNIRTEDNPNFDEVKSALSGVSDRIQKHKVKEGSFTIMLGRYTMHRVTEVQKSQPRISVVLSYELQPGVAMDVDTRLMSFGPTAPMEP